MFYQAVVVAVFLYGSESWNRPPLGMRILEGFHVEVACRLTGMRPQQQPVGPWVYPKSKEVLRAACLRTIKDYVGQQRHSIAKTIEGRTLLEEYMGAERKQGSPSRQYWWEQEMELMEEEDGVNGGTQGVFPRLFYDEAGNKVGADQGQSN
jgi:hypothetical protein